MAFIKGQIPWNKGIPQSENTKQKNREKHLGKKHTDKSKRKMSEIQKRLTQRDKQIIGVGENTRTDDGRFAKGRKFTDEEKKALSERIKKQYKKGRTKGMLGKTLSMEARIKLSKKHSGKNSHLWRGGITPINDKIRHSIKYKTWRNSVYKRDGWTCKKCGIKCLKGNIIAHHIKSFADYIKLRFDIDNGITLCLPCHARLHRQNYGNKKQNKQ